MFYFGAAPPIRNELYLPSKYRIDSFMLYLVEMEIQNFNRAEPEMRIL